MYFHTNNSNVSASIVNAATIAHDDNLSLRFDVDNQGRLRFKVGEGMWSAPIDSTFDPYRDNS